MSTKISVKQKLHQPGMPSWSLQHNGLNDRTLHKGDKSFKVSPHLGIVLYSTNYLITTVLEHTVATTWCSLLLYYFPHQFLLLTRNYAIWPFPINPASCQRDIHTVVPRLKYDGFWGQLCELMHEMGHGPSAFKWPFLIALYNHRWNKYWISW